MCGIFGYIGKRTDSAKIVFDGLKSLEYRGYDSWGVAVLSKSSLKIFTKKAAGKIGNNNVNALPDGNIAIGHTRWATHGGVTDTNSHPHSDCSGNISIIHNGIFENYEDYKKKLVQKGHKFISETDTEVISHLVEDFSKKLTFSDSVKKTFNLMTGLNAIIAVKLIEDRIVAIRNGSPLVVGFGQDENFLASDASALLPFTKDVYFLEDDEMVILERGKVRVSNVKTGKIVRFKKQKLNWNVDQGEMGKYSSFMLKEINEQPKILREIAMSAGKNVEKISKIIKKSRGSYLVGCGSASYAAMAGTYLFSKIAGRHINFAIGSEFGYHLDFLNKDSLVIPISQSGETIDILESMKKAKERGAGIVSLVNVLGSSLYRMSDEKILIGAGPEKSVASTKALTGMIAHLVLLSFSLDGGVKKGKKALLEAANSIKKILSGKDSKNIKKLADIICDSKNIYVIGRGLSYPTALETAMKIKEISYIHAEGLAAGELKHGPLALVTKGTPCIAFLPNDETYGANLAGAMEMKARGGFVIGISFKSHEVFDYYIQVKDVGIATMIPNIVVGQLLAYFLTIKKGLDVDKPRNLAKSVTVK
ncbi:MAG: glutamine--fructose-6-phosphate transaminase (isomerizing) [Candidatus Woesebacteria bacterium]|nr:MAG: glutamine--fructose-6-phosphate transaminase (isomerizing) [Candidatus Woesebacteria bacterium]